MGVMITIIGAAYLMLLAFKAALALSYARRFPKPNAGADLSAATIVQPILSGDSDLAAALADNLAAAGEARFLWLVDESDVTAQQITDALIHEHNGHSIARCLCPDPPPGVNPKLFKLERARAHVTGGAFVVVDDDTRITRPGLAALLAGLETHTIATGVPCYRDRGNLLSRLVAQFVNNNAALTYLPLLVFAPPPTINGMTYAIKPAVLAQLGGFAPLWHEVADDLAVAGRVLQAGGTILQTPFPQFVATSVREAGHYWSLMHRWFVFALLLLQEQTAAWRMSISVLHGLPPVLLWSIVLSAIASPGLMTLAVASFVVATRAAILIVVQRSITGTNRHSPLLSVAAELLQPLHMGHAACSRRIKWRSREYRVRAHNDFGTV